MLLVALLTQLYELRVGHIIIVYPAQCYLDGAGGDVIQKGAVVAHQQYCCLTLAEEVFQPLNTLDIQVIGGLIE